LGFSQKISVLPAIAPGAARTGQRNFEIARQAVANVSFRVIDAAQIGPGGLPVSHDDLTGTVAGALGIAQFRGYSSP